MGLLGSNILGLSTGDFILSLSAELKSIEGLEEVKFSGAIEGIKIDMKKLANFEFPIIAIGAMNVTIEADVFGGQLTGSLTAGILNIDEDNEIIPSVGIGDVPIKKSIFYLGVQGEFAFSGMSGFSISFGISELGPLGVMFKASGHLLLDPVSQIYLA